MRIVINGTGAVTGGGITYLLNLLPALSQVDGGNEYRVLLSTHQAQLQFDLPDNFRVRRIHFPRPNVLWRIIWEQTVLPLRLIQWRAHVLYAPADIAPLLAPCPVLLAVRNPHHCGLSMATTWRGRLRHTVLRQLASLSGRKARCVLFVSKASADELGPHLQIPPSKRSVVHHGLGSRFKTDTSFDLADLQRYGLEGLHYVLCVSALYPHKNIETLIQGFGRWVKDSGDRERLLVLAGRVVDSIYFERLERLVAEWGLAERVRFLGEVPYADVPALYWGADVFILPSRLETFGHPLVEAMASGVPVISSGISVAREVCGEAALYFSPTDSISLATRLAEVLDGPASIRARLVERGLIRSAQFSWERASRETLALLKAVAEDKATA